MDLFLTITVIVFLVLSILTALAVGVYFEFARIRLPSAGAMLLALGLLLVCASLGSAAVALERTDGLDYPDGGNAEWFGFAALGLFLIGVPLAGLAFDKSVRMPERTDAPSNLPES